MSHGKLLYNRVCVNEWARISLRNGWKDCGTGDTRIAETIEGRVIGRTGHRVSIHVGKGVVRVLRRVDIESIEVKLGNNPVDGD